MQVVLIRKMKTVQKEKKRSMRKEPTFKRKRFLSEDQLARA